MSNIATPLLPRTTCPHCWNTFPVEEVLWVSAHSDLLGDPRLGETEQQRFLPSRFDVQGNARDARGIPCHVLACPRCYLPVPRSLLEMEPFFVSILGSPACGKSYYLAAMTWQLRQVLPRDFAVSFQDADPTANSLVNDYEQSLFLNANQDELIPLGALIRKTETQGGLYDSVRYGNQVVNYPRPLLFNLNLLDRHPNAAAAGRLARLLCLYDNAGEHFQPGMDSTNTPATRHLAHSRLLFFLFDPSQDQRFRELCRTQGQPFDGPAAVQSRQELVLLEAAARVRRFTGLAQASKHPRPLLVLVTKYDSWHHLLDNRVLKDDPWKPARPGVVAMDQEQIRRYSGRLRGLLLQVCPEVVNAAENFAQHVVYFPVSALGRRPQLDPRTNVLAICPRNLRPIWGTAPLLYGLCKSLPGMIGSIRTAPRPDGAADGRVPLSGERP